MPTLLEIIERLNTLLARYSECRIFSYDGSRLVIIGDWDLSYHHNFEAEFIEVSYIQCANFFDAQRFRTATALERGQLQLSDHSGEEDTIFCFEADEHQFFIAAQNLELREEFVLHHQPSR